MIHNFLLHIIEIESNFQLLWSKHILYLLVEMEIGEMIYIGEC